MLFLFLAAFYGLCFYLFCAPLFWLALQFVPDRRQRQQALRMLGTLGLGLLALLSLSFVPVESLSTRVSTLVGTRHAPISTEPSAPPSSTETFLRTTNEDLAEMSHALNAVSRMRRTHGEQALP
jgi:hypothetical protein